MFYETRDFDVCLQKDAKQCHDLTNHDRTNCWSLMVSLTTTMSMIKLCQVTALFGVSLEIDNTQNLTKQRLLISNLISNDIYTM